VEVTGVAKGDLVLVHGAAGGVGTSVLQQARLLGATVIGTARDADFEAVRDMGAVPVAYGPGLAERLHALAGGGIDAALDCVGTDEAVDVSHAAVADKQRIVSTAAFGRASDGIQLIGASNPSTGPYRASQRARLPAAGRLRLPLAPTFPMDNAPAGVAALMGEHAYGKLALVA
jgi:NADPH:quinone reductase-like Zn-dependent oxidoreductase